MDDDIFDPFDSEFTGAPQSARPEPQIWVGAPAVNSVELSLRAEMHTGMLLGDDLSFDDDIETDRTLMPDAMVRAITALQSAFLEHVALARSLGPDASREDYERACARENIRPIKYKW